MRPRRLLLSMLLIAATAVAATSFAAAPLLMNYQGRLTDLSGTPLDTTLSITFAVYFDSTTSSSAWTETHDSVVVADGLFHVILGSIHMLDYSVFDSVGLWLGVKVGADPEISPRSRIVSAAFAQRVSTVDNTSGGTVYGSIDLTADLYVGNKGTIGPGHTNSGSYGFVAGQNNVVSGDWAAVGGGKENEALGLNNTVGGGGFNMADEDYATVAGGVQNEATSRWATVGGGNFNRAWDTAATVAGGNGNRADGPATTVGGGGANYAADTASTISGGSVNTANGYGATVGGGIENIADGIAATVGGGVAAYAQADYATVSGGAGVVANGQYATIIGGSENYVFSDYGVIAGGRNNIVNGVNAFAAGRRAHADHDGSFVWADDNNSDFVSTGSNQFIIRAGGGVGIGTNSPSEALDVNGNLNVSGDIYGNVDNADRVDGQHYNPNWPTTLSNVQSATGSDFHNIGGTDQVDDAVADCADVDACGYTGSIKHWQWMSSLNSTGTIYENGYVRIERISSISTFQCECLHSSGCTYVYYLNGVRTAGNLFNPGDTVNLSVGTAPSDVRLLVAKRVNGLDMLTIDILNTNQPYVHMIGHDTQ